MERLVTTVFKILGGSLLLMFILDTSLLLVETISVHSKVSNVMGIVQMEVARNNCMPEEIATGFETYFTENLTESKLAPTFETNFRTKTNIHDEYALDPNCAGDYGQFKKVKVDVTIHPSYVYFTNRNSSSNINDLTRKDPLEVVMSYEYSVPCLRYLK